MTQLKDKANDEAQALTILCVDDEEDDKDKFVPLDQINEV
jgi:hypothetical protein